jgi:Protein of unknown function (DUF3631)
VGGTFWPHRAREIAMLLSGEESEMAEAEQLIVDIRAVWGQERKLKSADLVRRLAKIEGSPWPSLTAARMAQILSTFLDGRGGHIRPKQMRFGRGTAAPNANGYEFWQFENAFARYGRGVEGVGAVDTKVAFPPLEDIAAAVEAARQKVEVKRAERAAEHAKKFAAFREHLICEQDAKRAEMVAEDDAKIA